MCLHGCDICHFLQNSYLFHVQKKQLAALQSEKKSRFLLHILYAYDSAHVYRQYAVGLETSLH